MLDQYNRTPITTAGRHAGFNLIELMIVTGIIAVLAAIALPTYQGYVAKSQANAAFAEISQGRVQFEIRINDQQPITTASDIGLPGAAGRCRNVQVVYDSSNGEGHISCVATGNSMIDGKMIVLERADGRWRCTTQIEAQWRPKPCLGD